MFHLCSHCTNRQAGLRAPEHPSAVVDNSASQRGAGGSGQAGENIREKLFYAAQSAQSRLKGAAEL